jgi:hypothetical protein
MKRKMNKRVEQNSQRDAWYLDYSHNVSLNLPSRSKEDLQSALKNNRDLLETVKRKYCRRKQKEFLIHAGEIAGTIALLQREMRNLGIKYKIKRKDFEYPNDACGRFMYAGDIILGLGKFIGQAILAIAAVIVVIFIAMALLGMG